jgi:DNA-binding LacI/PurR family transcriptional regulator
MYTIQDVAAHAGVSVSTVSNVLNGREARMRPETLARVKKTIADLGFRPNQSARMLKTGYMPMIGLMVPTVANPYFGTLARWVEGRAAELGYGLLLCNTYRNPDRERDYAEAFLAQGIKGVILGSALAAHEHLVPLINKGMAVVSLDRACTSDELLRDLVSVDNELAGAMAVDHLTSLGHRHIAFVNAPAQSVNRLARQEGAQQACDRAGATLQLHVSKTEGGYNESEMAEMGRAAARSLRASNSPATAFIGVNDMVAIGLLAGMREAHLQVPKEVSVIGIDGVFLGEYFSPALTSIGQPMQAMALAAVDHVLTRMKEPGLPPKASIFPPELVNRESTGPVAP